MNLYLGVFLVLLVVAIAIVAAVFGPTWYMQYKRSANFTTSGPAAQWVSSTSASCPTGINSLVNNACVLSEADAVSACASSASCIGYLKPAAGSAWFAKSKAATGSQPPPGSVLLLFAGDQVVPVNAATYPQYANVTYYMKKSVPATAYYFASAPSGQWVESMTGSCPGGFQSLNDTACVLPASRAQAACNADPNCVGFLVPPKGSDLYTNQMPYGSAWLADSKPVATDNSLYAGVTFYAKSADSLQ